MINVRERILSDAKSAKLRGLKFPHHDNFFSSWGTGHESYRSLDPVADQMHAPFVEYKWELDEW